MKSPGTASAKTSGKKAKAAGKFPSDKALRREYKGEARREEASARREEADASHRRAEAAHYQQEARKAEREGYKKEAGYDLAKAAREQAEARRDQAKAGRNRAKSARNRVKAARVGLAVPGAVSGGWIAGGNDWHQGCAAVALANCLYAATGLRVSDRDVLDLYWLTADDPGTGAGVLATLEAAAEFGLGGMRPHFTEARGPGLGAAPGASLGESSVPPGTGLECDSAALGAASRLTPLSVESVRQPETPCESTLLLDLRLQQAQRHQPVWDALPSPDWGAHAGVLAGDKVITWGREVPVTGDFLAQRVAGAWAVEWSGPGS